MSVPAIAGGTVTASDGLGAIQSRINEIKARFGGGTGVAFGAVLANQLGGLRTASSFSFSGGDAARVPAGSSPAVDVAQQYLGVPYVWGGESPSGFDCSGLVQYVYGQLGVNLPRTAADQARVGQPVASLADARPGDLLAFHDPVDHIGIYAGNGLMVVAPKTGDVVKVQNVYDAPTAIRRILPSGGSPGVASAYPAGDFAAQRASVLAALASFTGAAS